MAQAERDLEADYGRMVKLIAHKYNFPNPRLDFDDLVQEGSIAVVKAVASRPQDSEFKESTWVYNAIDLELKGVLRRNRYDLHVSEGKQKKSWKEDSCTELNKKAIAYRLDSSHSGMGNTDEYEITPSGEPPPDEKLAKQEIINIVTEEINALPEREQKVLRAWFFNDVTFRVLAAEMNVTEQRVAQIKDRAFKRLKENLIKNHKETLL